jgi:hypothetical protein
MRIQLQKYADTDITRLFLQLNPVVFGLFKIQKGLMQKYILHKYHFLYFRGEDQYKLGLNQVQHRKDQANTLKV